MKGVKLTWGLSRFSRSENGTVPFFGHRIVAALALAAVLWAAPAAGAEPGGGAALRQQLGWRPAPPVPAFTTRANLPARPTLQELISAGRQPAASQEAGPTSRTVMPGESYPAKYRGLIRRYFELIRSRETKRKRDLVYFAGTARRVLRTK